MGNSGYLDFDANPNDEKAVLKLVQDAYQTSRDQQQSRNIQYQRDYQNYNSWVDMTYRNPDLVNLFIPKTYVIVETKTARNINATIGVQPYIPFESINPIYRGQTQLMSNMLQYYLSNADFESQYGLSTKIKIPYGTSFMEGIPYYQQVVQKSIIIDPYTNKPLRDPYTGEFVSQQKEMFLLRFKVNAYSPWEVYADPHAKDLNDESKCRYIIIVQLVSKRNIAKMVQGGAYPGFDLEKLYSVNYSATATDKSDHWGLSMLSEMGIAIPDDDDDTCVIFRYQSPDRYIDAINGQIVLRDIDNPYSRKYGGHGKINLSKHKHNTDAHTQNQFWGKGECKPNEMLQSMLNDSWNQTFNSHQLHNQPIIYYKEGSLNPNMMVISPGARIPIRSDTDRSIRDLVTEGGINPLPRDHYLIPTTLERLIDQVSAVTDAQRGEQSSGGARTASEYAMRQQAGDIQLKQEVRQSERFLADFGQKMIGHITQFAQTDDYVDILGEQGAMSLLYTNPNDLPGGWNFTFKGSERAATQALKQRSWIELTPLISGLPNIRTGKYSEIMFRDFGIPENEILELVTPDEEMMRMQQEQEEKGFQRELVLSEQKFRQDIDKTRIQGEIKQKAQGASKKVLQTNQSEAQRQGKVLSKGVNK